MASNVQALWKLVVTYGPKAVTAVTLLTDFMDKHPDLPAHARVRLAEIPDRITEIHQRHGDAAKIRGMLAIIKDVGAELESDEVFGASMSARLVRADHIERGVRLAEAQPRPERKKTLAHLRTETGDLLADLIEVSTREASDLNA